MQRTPTNVPIQHVYPQSASFFIPTGVQGVSKGVLDESIAGQSISLIHGAQYGGSKIGESAAIFPSSDMQRIPTDVPIQNVYPQSTSFSIATGMQGVSKGMLDRSIAAQHRNFPLEKETWQSHADVLSGNIFQGTSFALQAPTLGTCADVPSRNILQPCSFPTHAETNGVYSNAPSESMLLQDNYFPKVTESDGFLSNVTASKKSAPATYQHQAFSNASDELSNALSINQAQDVTASKGKPFETMQPHLETIRRSEPEIHAHETLRSSYNVGRNEPDIFGLKQPMTANETPREADKNTLTSKQSVGSRKRHMMDTTPIVKESIPKSRSRLSLSNRSLDYIPHDDDVLASILGRTPSFKIKPTPVETVTAKRRRSTPRTTGRKRKALIDIAMVIHGDVIRQQLANTEDIRRVRKKAPCTPQEIRMIQKESQAHYIFFEPSIPGICMELQDLYGQVFGLTEGKLPQAGKNENFTETQKEREPISSLEPTNDSRMVQLEQAERPLEIVSEMESGGQHVGNVHVNGVHMNCFDGSRVQIDDGRGKQDQGQPLGTVSEILPTSLRMNNAHDKQQPEKSVEMGFAVESRRVHMDDFQKEQEQERLQMSVIEVESGRVRAYDDWQNQEQQPQTIGCEVESSQVHTGDVRQKIERPWMVVSDIELGRVLPSIESSRVFTVAVHQTEDQERSQGMASEIKSGRVHTLDVHQKQEREQERPRGIVLEIESSRVHAYDVQGKQSPIEAFPKTPINVVIGSEVSNVNKALESSMVQQSHSLSEIESSRVHTLDVHRNQEREQERPQQILSEIESIREHAYDIQGRQASIKALPENSINVITDSEVSNVKKTLESSMVQQGHALLEIESSRVHTLDVHRNQEREQEMPQQILLEMESGRVHAYDIQKKLASIEALPENPINVITGSDISNVRKTVESSMVQQGHTSLEIESSRVHRPQEIVLEIESNRVHAYGVQGKQASIEALPENPINAIAGSEISNVKQTLESTVVQQGHPFTNQVFVPQGITFKDYQVQGLQGSSALEGGCHNIREIYLSSHQFPLKSSCFSANQEMPLEINRGSHVLAEKHGVVAQDMEVSQCLAEKHGPAVRDLEVSQFLTEEHGVTVQDMEVSQCLAEKHGVDVQEMEVSQCVAGNYRANEGEKIISEDLEVAVMKKDGSNCLVENNGIHVVHTKEGTNMESISEVIKIDDERELRNKEQNIAQDRREQSREIAVIGTIEETVKDCESQRQTVCYSALISVQGKDSVPNNTVHTGDLRNLNTTINTSVQNSGAENTMQDEQVLVYEKSTKMSSNEAEAHGDVALRDREGQDGLNQIDQTVTDDEEFEFLGDADDTEFLEGDGNAQDEFDGKTKAPGTEEDRIQENSGWSARTRAVSRYLKTAFEGMDYDSKKPEAENRQKLSLDHLLMGKRRKEAARMFFETLVLKTRDYVNVEQKDSFDDISIYPRAKLMSTIF